MTEKPRILVVEDSAPIARILGLLLEGAGYTVTLADTGRAARAALGPPAPTPPIAAVVLDLSLPDVDGRTLLRELAGSGDYGPVVVVSAYASTLSADERALAAAVLSKPFDVDHLLGAVAVATGREPPDGYLTDPRPPGKEAARG